ncbi:MAG: ferritin family protein [Candidatus Cloacimonetes bacterium]|nr:ferritin family protein [Candidatus Cloacimonadota bacterium]
MPAFSVNEIIEMAVQIERNGYAFYSEASKRKDLDSTSREFIERLRDAEFNHERTFLQLREDQDLSVLELTPEWELVASYLKSIVDSRIFYTPDAAIKLASEAKNIRAIVDYAILFEKDTLLYFHAISDSISHKRAKAVLRRIIHEEVSHVLWLSDYQKNLA